MAIMAISYKNWACLNLCFTNSTYDLGMLWNGREIKLACFCIFLLPKKNSRPFGISPTNMEPEKKKQHRRFHGMGHPYPNMEPATIFLLGSTFKSFLKDRGIVPSLLSMS